jgi:hypothetical protein
MTKLSQLTMHMKHRNMIEVPPHRGTACSTKAVEHQVGDVVLERTVVVERYDGDPVAQVIALPNIE